MVSILENTSSKIHFYILDGGIDNFNKKLINKTIEKYNTSIKYFKVDMQAEFTKRNIDFTNNKDLLSHISVSAYNRYMIPVLEQNLDKVIYIDTDTIVVGDIKELYEQDLGKYALGAVNEKHLFFAQPYLSKFTLPWHSKFTTIFNSGVMIFDIKKFKQQDIVEKLFETTKQNQDKISSDQDVFNIVFKDNFKMLDTKFNNITNNLSYLQSIGKMNEIKTEEEKTIIRHYNTGEKPWNSKDTFNANWFWYYASKTEFYEIIKNNYNEVVKKKTNQTTTIKIKLFNLIPFLKIKMK